MVDDKNKYVMTIIHGSKEHSERYRDFRNELKRNGIDGDLGDLATHGQYYEGEAHDFSFDAMLQSALDIIDETKEKYKDYKHIIFGHSMGSFIVKYIVYSNLREFDGVILSGTNNPSATVVNFSLFLNGIGRKHKVHKFNEGLSYGYLSISSKMHGYGKNWISSLDDEVQKFEDDPLCGHDFTNQSLKTMFTFIKRTQSKDVLKKFKNKKIPQLLLWGTRDPVGNFGKDVDRLIKKQEKFGIDNHISKAYFGSKHEVLNDQSREKVIQDIVDFVKEKC